MSHIEFLDNDQTELLGSPTITFDFVENIQCGQKNTQNFETNLNTINFIHTTNNINENKSNNIHGENNNNINQLLKDNGGNSNKIYFNLSSKTSNSKLRKIQELSLNPVKLTKEKKKKTEIIFDIKRDNKNIGRIKKNSNLIGKHDKFSQDNIIRKFKGRFHEKCRIYINNEYKRYLLNHKHDIKKINDLLQRISPKISRKIKKEDNLKWLEMKLKQVFSENVSEKCSLYPADYNKNNISKLYEENEAKNVIDILNKPVKEMLGYFINNVEIPGFDTLDKDIKELENKMKKDNERKINNYIDTYRRTSKNFESIFINKSSRTNK